MGSRMRRWLGLGAAVVIASTLGLPVRPVVAAPDSSPQVTHDVVYGNDGGTSLPLDIYRLADGSQGRPAIVTIHGGGWATGDKSDMASVAMALANAGAVVFNIDYRLATADHPGYPGQIQDVDQAVAWVRAHAGHYGANPRRVGLLGASAGAYLAAMVGTEDSSPRGGKPVDAVVMLSGPSDLVSLGPQVLAGLQGQCDAACVSDRSEHIDLFLGCSITVCAPDLLKQASPIDHVTSRTPPFFIANSTDELVPLPQAQELAGRLQQFGVPADLDVIPGDRHGLNYAPELKGPLRTFFQAHLTANSVGTSPASSGLAWWVLGLAAAGGLALIGAVVLGVRRARRRWYRVR